LPPFRDEEPTPSPTLTTKHERGVGKEEFGVRGISVRVLDSVSYPESSLLRLSFKVVFSIG
jgi:hypothetical protein